MHSTFKIKRNKKTQQNIKKLKYLENLKIPEISPQPKQEQPYPSFKQYCLNQYRKLYKDQNSNFQFSINSEHGTTNFENSFIDDIIQQELENQQIEDLQYQTHSAFITQNHIKQKQLIPPKQQSQSQEEYVLGDLKTYFLNQEKKNKFKDYIQSVVNDTAVVRDEAYEKANKTFGNSSRWKKVEFNKKYFTKERDEIITQIQIENWKDQENQLLRIHNNKIYPIQNERKFQFQNWNKKELGQIRSRVTTTSHKNQRENTRQLVTQGMKYRKKIDRPQSVNFDMDYSLDYFMKKK